MATCSQAIRANDPDAILISAGLAPTGNDDDLARRDDLYLQDSVRCGLSAVGGCGGRSRAGLLHGRLFPRPSRTRWAWAVGNLPPCGRLAQDHDCQSRCTNSNGNLRHGMDALPRPNTAIMRGLP
ncbi:MAG UNVERIFIED_CONTAM: hypothetical protein LVT10_16870 [Anaerolineae bacterium]